MERYQREGAREDVSGGVGYKGVRRGYERMGGCRV